MPEHGERQNEDYPIMVWNGVKDLKSISNYVLNNWKEINLYACSLGAYFSLLAYKDINIKKCLFQCPVLNMMKWFNITEDDLRKENSIPTPVGETLYWDYWIYTKENPINKWTVDTYIFYPSKDSLTERSTIDEFISDHSPKLTVLDGAEHYFTDCKSLEKLEIWLQINQSKFKYLILLRNNIPFCNKNCV